MYKVSNDIVHARHYGIHTHRGQQNPPKKPQTENCISKQKKEMDMPEIEMVATGKIDN